MITLIGLPIIGAAVAVILVIWLKPYDLIFSSIFMPIMGAALGFLLWVMASLAATPLIEGEWRDESTASIKSLQDTRHTSGSFFLGSGSIDSKPVFWYYADNGGYSTLEYRDASSVHIVETDDQEPRVTEQRFHSNNRWFHTIHDGARQYVFYIPEGSITNNFELDARP